MNLLTIIGTIEIVVSAACTLAFCWVYMRRLPAPCVAALAIVYGASALQGLLASVGPDMIRDFYGTLFGPGFDPNAWHLVKEDIDLSVNAIVNALTIGAAALLIRFPNRAIRDIATWAGIVGAVAVAEVAIPDETARTAFDIWDSVISGLATAAVGWGILRFAARASRRGTLALSTATLYFLSSIPQACYWLVVKFLHSSRHGLETYSIINSTLAIGAGVAAVLLFGMASQTRPAPAARRP